MSEIPQAIAQLNGLPVADYSEGAEDWNLQVIVSSLRSIRERSALVSRHQQCVLQLPSRELLADVVDGLNDALFPHRLGIPETDYFVGHTLDASLRLLEDQIHIELNFSSPYLNSDPDISSLLKRQAQAVVGAFAAQLPAIRSLLELDIAAAFHGDPAAGSLDEVLVCYPGVKAITCHRFAHALYRLGVPVIARIIAEISHSTTGVDIHPGAVIGESFFIDHGSGVVIGGTAVIGNGVRLYQAVTLGAKHFPVDDDGHLIKGEARHPIIEDNVVIYAGATVLGRITIGRGATIGGNVWITRSIPAGTTITQAKARQEIFGEGSGI